MEQETGVFDDCQKGPSLLPLPYLDAGLGFLALWHAHRLSADKQAECLLA